jgi:hypothetical protein
VGVRGSLVLATLLALLVVVPAARPGSTPFVVGFADDLPEQDGTAAVTPARQLGATALRFTLRWAPGESTLSTQDAAALDRGMTAAGSLRVLLGVYGTSPAAPLDATARAQYCGFVADALRRETAIHDVAIWNEPNKAEFWSPQANPDGSDAAAPAYEALLSSCYDALHARFPSVNVLGFALAHSGNDDAQGTSPGAFIRDVGTAYRASGRSLPVLDTVAFQPYPVTSTERPWAKHVASKTIGEGDWNKLMYNLWLAFDGTAQPIPGQGAVTIWYTEVGFQTTVAAAKAALYSGTENVATLPEDVGGETDPHPSATSAAPDQATQIHDALALAACQPYVGAYFNFLLADEAVLTGWQSGALYPNLSPKASSSAFGQAIGTAVAGSVDCSSLKGGVASGDFMPPSTPTGLVASATAAPPGVALTWNASSDDQSAVAYRVYRDGSQVDVSTSPAWTDTSVSAGHTYRYTVRAIDSASNLGEASTPASATVSASAPPPQPSSEGGHGGGGSVPNLGVSIAANRTIVPPGGEADVAVTIANRGEAGSLQTHLVIRLPATMTLLGPPAYQSGSGCDGSQTIDCFLDYVPNGGSTVVHFNVDVSGTGSQSISVTVTADRESDPADNDAALTLEVTAPPAPPVTEPKPPVTPRRHRVAGTKRADTLRGTARADVIRGLAGNDLLLGLGGNDVLDGGSGRDRIFGGQGNDTIRADDGQRDTVDCGSGRDVVHADRFDVVRKNCERRLR